MAYDYRLRLARNRERFTEVNTLQATYHFQSDLPDLQIAVSPIFKRAFALRTDLAMTIGERQHFAINLQQGDVTLPLPDQGDTITLPNGNVYRVVAEDQGPPYQYITTARDRIMVFTVLEETGD